METTWKQVVYDVADAIREKTGRSDTIPVGELPDRIKGISGGFPNGTEWTQSNITSGTFYTVHAANGVWVAGGYNKALEKINWCTY